MNNLTSVRNTIFSFIQPNDEELVEVSYSQGVDFLKVGMWIEVYDVGVYEIDEILDDRYMVIKTIERNYNVGDIVPTSTFSMKSSKGGDGLKLGYGHDEAMYGDEGKFSYDHAVNMGDEKQDIPEFDQILIQNIL